MTGGFDGFAVEFHADGRDVLVRVAGEDGRGGGTRDVGPVGSCSRWLQW
jgi:hypothetical protein